MSPNSLIFHCAQPVLDADGVMILNNKGQVVKKKITHTLVFEKINEDTLAVGWAQAHNNDSYSKKTGTKIATNRLDLLKNRIENFPDRKVFKLPTITEKHLPKHVLSNSFDYYLNTAVSNLLDLDSINSVNMMFRSTSKEEPVCEIEVSAEDIRDSINANIENSIYSAKVNSEMRSEYIFCTYYDENELVIAVQARDTFYNNGMDMATNVDTALVCSSIVELDDSFIQVDGQTKIVSPQRKEYDVIIMLRGLGISYDGNLEREFINDED